MSSFLLFIGILILLVSAFIVYAIVHAIRFKNKVQDAVMEGVASGTDKLISEHAPRIISKIASKANEKNGNI